MPRRTASPRRKTSSSDRPALSGETAFFVIALGVLGYGLATLAWSVPGWVAAFLGGASLLSLAFYAIDKAAAERGGQRIPERVLLLLDLAGGWPGGLLAQAWFRHKSVKASYRWAFWAVLLLNVSAFVALFGPFMRR